MGPICVIFLAVVATALSSESTIQTVEDRVGNLERTLQALQNALFQKENRIKSLESKSAQQTSEISKLRDCVRDFKKTLQQPNISNGYVENSESQRNADRGDENDGDKVKNQMPPHFGIKENNNNNWNISNSIFSLQNRKRQSAAQQVAFHAYQHDSRVYSYHDILQYDVEEVDVGGGFNQRDSIFDVPVTGTYVFTWTTVPNLSSYVQTELIINGVVKGNAYAESNETHNVHPSTGIVVVQVNKGDHVYVRRGEHSESIVKSDNIYQRTTFSGWLLM
ncbi:hypothetical protein ACJMK2_037145 [Sinanodonta woodiana]|uniref:C1q domain-containing protein n=1 Tax=Sinanodonta woodiana TaxID=1069815 RepID=A0ABD3WJD0_SINWO